MKAIVILKGLSDTLPHIAIVRLPDNAEENSKLDINYLLSQENNPLPSDFPTMTYGDFIVLPDLRKSYRLDRAGWKELKTFEFDLARHM